jgi:transposase
MQLHIPSEKEIRETCREGEDAVVALIQKLSSGIATITGITLKQQALIEKLQGQIAKNSSNSSKPPSSDGLRKKRTNSLRKNGVKPAGGQKGHQGQTLMQVQDPYQTVVHQASNCTHCQTSLDGVPVVEYENRQVFDIPAISIEVTEHKSEIKFCPRCGKMNKGLFPDQITQPVQYGYNVKSHAVYFNHYHHVPVARTAEIFEDIFGHRISEAVILRSANDASTAVAPCTEAVKELLKTSDVVHFDESGLKVKAKLHWLHVASNDKLTHYDVHEKRGQAAMDDIGILPEFQGTAIHDHWKSYFAYESCDHGLCNAHHLRELKFIYEHYGQAWAQKMTDLLIEVKKEVESEKAAGNDHIDDSQINAFERTYDKIVEEGIKVNPPPEQQTGKRGKVKQSPPKNLLDRLKSHKVNVLLFMHDFRVPFDNNQGERDVRMVKVKQKVSGTFRTDYGADIFCRIRGYISTVRKNGFNVINAIQNAFTGTPFIPGSST